MSRPATLGLLLLCWAACGERPAPPAGDPVSTLPAVPNVPPLPELSLLDPPVAEQYREARAILDRLLTEERSSETQRARAHGELGRVYHAYRRHAEARDLYRAAHLLDPGEARWPHLLGLVESRLGRLEAAEAAFRAALELRPANAALLVYLGENAFERQDVTAAEEHFTAALATDPSSARARLGLGRVHLTQGRAEAAASELERAAAGSESPALVYPLAMAYRQAGRLQESRSLLERLDADFRTREPLILRDPVAAAVEALRRDANHFEHRALKAIAREDFPAAVEDFRRVLAVRPERLEARQNLALALLRTGRGTEARSQLERALELDPDFLPSRLTLARFLAAAGWREEAAAHLRRALEAHPDSTEARELLAELRAGGAP